MYRVLKMCRYKLYVNVTVIKRKYIIHIRIFTKEIFIDINIHHFSHSRKNLVIGTSLIAIPTSERRNLIHCLRLN